MHVGADTRLSELVGTIDLVQRRRATRGRREPLILDCGEPVHAELVLIVPGHEVLHLIAPAGDLHPALATVPRADRGLARIHQNVVRGQAVDGTGIERPGDLDRVEQSALHDARLRRECIRQQMPPALVVRGIAVLVAQHAALGVDPPARPAGQSAFRRDPHDSVGGLRPVQSAGRGSLHDLEAGDVLGIDVVDAGRGLTTRVDRERLAAVLDANAVHVVDRLVAEGQARLAADANPRARADRAA